jgi:hypothetical protein
MAKRDRGGKSPRRVMLSGYAQIRAFFKEMGVNPPPHISTLYNWSRRKGLPVRKVMGGKRVFADAAELARWIRTEYFGPRVGEDPPEATETNRE